MLCIAVSKAYSFKLLKQLTAPPLLGGSASIEIQWIAFLNTVNIHLKQRLMYPPTWKQYEESFLNFRNLFSYFSQVAEWLRLPRLEARNPTCSLCVWCGGVPNPPKCHATPVDTVIPFSSTKTCVLTKWRLGVTHGVFRHLYVFLYVYVLGCESQVGVFPSGALIFELFMQFLGLISLFHTRSGSARLTYFQA